MCMGYGLKVLGDSEPPQAIRRPSGPHGAAELGVWTPSFSFLFLLWGAYPNAICLIVLAAYCLTHF